MMWILMLSVIAVTCSLSQVTSLTGIVCPKRRSRYVTRYQYVSQAYQSRYTTSCGVFGWWRCTRWRTRYRSQRVSYVALEYYYINVCCSGWRIGPTPGKCGIHNLLPKLVSCPNDKIVTGARKTPLTRVTWNAPKFREPHNFHLTILSTYGREWANLPWGSTTVTYTATSQNNNMQTTCTFHIRVNPPEPLPEIGFNTMVGKKILYLTDKRPVTVVCRADHGIPAMILKWLIDGQYVTNGTRYDTKPNGFEAYIDAMNVLTFLPGKEQHNKTLLCQGSRPGESSYYDSVHLSITYELGPLLDFCPADLNITTSERFVTLSWPWPRFTEPKGEDLFIKASVPSNDSQEFGWGTNAIQYIAENPRTKKAKECVFHRNVWPHTCNSSLDAPVMGAMVCGKWDTFKMVVCQGFCHQSRDVLPQDKVPQYWVCGATGYWFPKMDIFGCLAKKDVLLSADRLDDHSRYFTGNCTEPSVKKSLSDTYMQMFKSSPFSSLCNHGQCYPTKVDVKCGYQ